MTTPGDKPKSTGKSNIYLSRFSSLYFPVRPSRLLVRPPLFSDEAIAALYQALLGERQVAGWALRIMTAAHLLSLQATLSCVRAGDRLSRIRGLQTLRAHQSLYTRGDLETIRALMAEIREGDSERAETVISKKLLGGTSPRWLCLCGKENKPDAERCSQCSRDVFGFGETDVTPKLAFQLLGSLIESLEVALGPG